MARRGSGWFDRRCAGWLSRGLGLPGDSWQRPHSRLLMNCFVLGDDVGWNAATLIDLVAVGLRPLADSLALLSGRSSARAPAASLRVSRTDFARVFHIVGKFSAKLAGVP